MTILNKVVAITVFSNMMVLLVIGYLLGYTIWACFAWALGFLLMWVIYNRWVL